MTSREDRERRGHDAFRLLAAAAVDGRIDPDDAVALEAHLATCQACRADQQAMLRDHLWLADPGPATPPSPAIRDVVLGAARSNRVPRTQASERPWAGLVAASLVVAIGGAALLFLNARTPGGVGATGSGGPTRGPASRAAPTSFVLSSLMPTGPCAPRPAGLTSWWTGNGDARDVAGGHDATTHGNVQFTPGIVADALTLDGISAYADVPEDPAVDVGARDFTIQLWVRFNDLAGEPVLIEQWHDLPAGYPAAVGWTLQKTNPGGLALYAGNATDQFGAGTVPLPFRTGVWYHVAARRSGAEIALFVNGVVINEGSRSGGPLDLHVDAPIVLGRRNDQSGDFLNGQLDEVQLLVGRALSDAEIEAVYQAGSTGFCPA
jgi:hypothetical protein